MSRPLLHLLASTLLLSFVPWPASTQEGRAVANQPEPDIYVESVNVDVINIDVYVTDKKTGLPVRDLTIDDFELFVDGRKSTISNFYAVSGRAGPPVRDPGAEKSEPEPPPEPARRSLTDTGREAPSPDQRLHLILYVDNYNLTPFSRNKVLNELRQFLRTELSPHDEVMLATYDRELNLRQPFTGSPGRVIDALLSIEDISAQRIHFNNERMDLLRDIQIPDGLDITYDEIDLLSRAMSYAGSMYNDMTFTIGALTEMVRNLSGSTGRKAIVYVSDGLPMIAGEDIFNALYTVLNDSTYLSRLHDYDLTRQYQALAQQANQNRVSFYTIDARGLTVMTAGTVDPANEWAAGTAQYIDTIERQNLQNSIQFLADETGGRSFINTNRFLPDLKRMAQDFRNYYSLGYSPIALNAADRRYHRFEVKVKGRRDVNVRHRQGYRLKSLEARMKDGTMSALNLDMEENPIGVDIIFREPTLLADGNWNLPVVITMPLNQLVAVPQQGSYRGKVSAWLAVKDDKGDTSEVTRLPIPISIPEDRWADVQNRMFEYSVNLTVEEGYHDLAVGLRDELGAKSSFVRRGVTLEK